MLYELRIYEIPAGRMKDINDRFANHTVKIWARHGIKPVGFWENVIGPNNTLVYMLAWESLADREKKWAAFQSDPEWIKVSAETNKNGQIVLKTNNTIMKPTAYSPMQ